MRDARFWRQLGFLMMIGGLMWLIFNSTQGDPETRRIAWVFIILGLAISLATSGWLAWQNVQARKGEAEVMPDDLTFSIRQLLKEGRKIQAIKLYRKHTGAGVREAKEAVEAIKIVNSE